MADLGSYLPSPGSAVWRRDVASSPEHQQLSSSASGSISVASLRDSGRVRHVVIRDAEIWEEPAPYVVYKINVMTEHDHWFLFRRYSQFHSLHKKLVKQYGVNKDLLPPKKISGNLSKQLIDKRRKLLERYLQKIIHGEPQVSRSPELHMFLDTPTHDVIKVTDILTRHLYLHGDQLLEESTPIALSVNEMYAITRRLQLPRDATGADPDDVSADPAHLYSFVHQLERLRISLPPSPCSVSCTTFDLAPFRSLHTLKLDQVPMSQVGGLLLIQQQLSRVSVHRSLHGLHELLVEGVEERRGSEYPGGVERRGSRSSSVEGPENWRLSATAKLAGARVVVQPWHKLHTLTLSHNFITHLDNSLQMLPTVRELTLSYNKLKVLSLQYLCLPSLEKLNLSHNQIHTIKDDRKVLERITHLSLSNNQLGSLDGITAFVGLCVLNLSFNVISSNADLSKLVQLKRLNMLSMAGNPISSFSAYRIMVLAKFMRKSRMICIDGVEPTPKEQAKIKSYNSKYGSDPDLWPIAKSFSAHPRSHRPHPLSASGERPGSTTPTTPHVDLSWQISSGSGPHGSSGMCATPTGSPSPSVPRADRRSLDRFSFPSSSSDSLEQPQLEGGQFRYPRGRGITEYGTPQLPLARGRSKHPMSSSFSGPVRSSGPINEEERFSVGVDHNSYRDVAGGVVGGVADRRQVKGFTPRSEPDGQSDISSTSPDLVAQRSQRGSVGSLQHSTLSPPPSTPILPPDETLATPITPAVLQSALDALEGIPDKATPLSLTPHQQCTETNQGVLPEAVTSALTKWISSQSLHTSGGPSHSSLKATPLLTPPPSTPVRTMVKDSSYEQLSRSRSVSERQGISAGDLIAALSTLMVSSEDKGAGSRSSSGHGYSVPASTPNEGAGPEGIEGWAKLGIRPDEVIQALSALTIQQDEDQDEEDGHRTCHQQRTTPSPDPPERTTTPPPTLLVTGTSPSPSPAPNSDYLCLFPESTHTYLDSYQQEVDVANSSYEDESLLEHQASNFDPTGHTVQSDNEFAELDPYLALSHDSMHSSANFDPPTSESNEWKAVSSEAEVGVDVMSRTIAPVQGEGQGEESSSPIESVLYSHPHY